MKKILKIFLYLVYSFIFVLVLIYFLFYLPFVKKIKINYNSELNFPKNVATSTVKQLSYVVDGKRSSFNNFKFKKDDGVIRIGAFGDSFTYGDEVDEKSDYPSILQELFIRNGYENVEVLNFGSSGYGGHQAIRLWELEGKKYDLDFILFGPYGFWPDRDLSFNKNSFEPGLIAGRYILKNNDVRFVEPIGNNIEERVSAYYSFFPKKIYLKYDSKLPLFLRSMMREGAVIDNPFYYNKDKNEYYKIYDYLFEMVASRHKQVIHLYGNTMNTPIVDIENVYSDELFNNWSLLFMARNAHYGPLINGDVARQFFSLLTGQKFYDLEYIKTRGELELGNFSGFDLSQVTNICLGLDDVLVSFLADNDKETISRDKITDCSSNNTFYSDNDIKSIFVFNPTKESLFDYFFLPLDFNIQKEDKLFFEYRVGNDLHIKEVSDLSFFTENIVFVESDFMERLCVQSFKHFKNQELVFNATWYNELGLSDKLENIDDMVLKIGEHEIYSIRKLEGNVDNILHLIPSRFSHYVFSSLPSYPFDLNQYNEYGDINLSFFQNGNILNKIRIGSWEQVKDQKSIIDDKIKYYIKKNKEGIALIVENN